jgi:hypothetical protein
VIVVEGIPNSSKGLTREAGGVVSTTTDLPLSEV